MKIKPPRLDLSHPSYRTECEESLEVAARELVDCAIITGWSPPILFGSLVKVIDDQRNGYAEDSDPAEGPARIS